LAQVYLTIACTEGRAQAYTTEPPRATHRRWLAGTMLGLQSRIMREAAAVIDSPDRAKPERPEVVNEMSAVVDESSPRSASEAASGPPSSVHIAALKSRIVHDLSSSDSECGDEPCEPRPVRRDRDHMPWMMFADKRLVLGDGGARAPARSRAEACGVPASREHPDARQRHRAPAAFACDAVGCGFSGCTRHDLFAHRLWGCCSGAQSGGKAAPSHKARSALIKGPRPTAAIGKKRAAGKSRPLVANRRMKLSLVKLKRGCGDMMLSPVWAKDEAPKPLLPHRTVLTAAAAGAFATTKTAGLPHSPSVSSLCAALEIS
jgi:hypothetical protein